MAGAIEIGLLERCALRPNRAGLRATVEEKVKLIHYRSAPPSNGQAELVDGNARPKTSPNR
jgi:hypothetical protein